MEDRLSVSSVQSQIAQVQREIESLARRQTDKKSRLADRAARIASIQASVTARTSPSMIQSKSRDITRLQRESASLQRDDSELQKQLATKTEKLHRLQRDLYSEQDREQKRYRETVERQARADREAHQRVLGAIRPSALADGEAEYDAFISHASEDKDDIVRPLADALEALGNKIWFDESALRVGDSLRRSIDHGLSRSRFGIVILSAAFFAKNWPQYELDGLVAKEVAGGKVILPIWHKVSKDEVLRYSPTLADRVALNTATLTIQELAARLTEAIATVGT
jgi:hypothetical protein